MKQFFSGTEVQWWLRSRKSGRLNSLSYWLFVLLFSAALSLVLSALWQVYVAQQTRLRRAAEQMDWLGDAPLKALEPYRGTFLGQREKLINRVRYGDQSPGGGDLPLRPAGDVKNIDGKPPIPTPMFDNPDVRVYPSFATFAPQGRGEGLTEAEAVVFNNFANFMTSLYEGRKDTDANHVERSLAAAFGLVNPDTGTSPLDVPWVYVASKEGAIAVFPGTQVVDEPSWKTTSRPWFRAALGGDTQLFTKGLMPEDMLTTTYLDVLAKQPMQVRTYMYKFQLAAKNAPDGTGGTPQEFVICLDIFRNEKRAAGLSPTTAVQADSGAPFANALLPPGGLGLAHYVAFGLSVLFFMTLRWLSTTRDSELTFERTRSLVGRLRAEDGLRTQSDDQAAQEYKVGVELGRYAVGRAERSALKKNNVIVHTSVEKSRADLRGCELWEVTRNVTASWSIFGIRFKSNKQTYVGAIRLVYTSEVLPEADWISYDACAFNETEATELYARLPPLLARNANLCDGSLGVPERGTDLSTFLRAPEVPDWVRYVVNTKELTTVHQRRAAVRMTSEQLGELYSTAEVKAVMASGYFEELLNHGHCDVLLKGKAIYRIISLPDDAAELNLHDGAWVALAELIGNYSPAGTRRLQRVSMPIGDQSEPSPVYDFALLDDTFVIVVHSASKLVGIDCASGRPTNSTYVVEGYMSWRAADVAFYRGLFYELAARAKALTLPADKLEFIDGRPDPLKLSLRGRVASDGVLEQGDYLISS